MEAVDVIRLAELREAPLSVGEVSDAVMARGAGGVAVFTGVVRDHDAGRGVTALRYSAHPSAEAELQRVLTQIADKYPVDAVAAVHRVGDLKVGDLAVVVATSSPHRAEALDACRALIDELKASVPIWKHQLFDDGTTEWVGCA